MKNLAEKVKVVPQWKKIFFTYSFWLHVSSVVLTFIEQILPFAGLLEPTMTVQTYSIFMFVLNGLGLLARFVRQKNLWSYPTEEDREDGP